MRKSKYGKLTFAFLLAAGISGGASTRADQNDNTKAASASDLSTRHLLTATDQASQVKQAAEMNMAVIKVSELAAQKAQNPELKSFASTLQKDHRQAQQDLERIAQKENVTLPTTVDPKCQEEISRLESLSGSAFDREFVKGAIEGHAMAIAMLQHSNPAAGSLQSSGLNPNASSTSTDKAAAGAPPQGLSGSSASDLQQYNQRMLARTKEHQQQAREIAKSLGITQSTITSWENDARQEAVGGPGSSTRSTGRSNSSLNDTSTDKTNSKNDSTQKHE